MNVNFTFMEVIKGTNLHEGGVCTMYYLKNIDWGNTMKRYRVMLAHTETQSIKQAYSKGLDSYAVAGKVPLLVEIFDDMTRGTLNNITFIYNNIAIDTGYIATLANENSWRYIAFITKPPSKKEKLNENATQTFCFL